MKRLLISGMFFLLLSVPACEYLFDDSCSVPKATQCGSSGDIEICNYDSNSGGRWVPYKECGFFEICKESLFSSASCENW
ncbi:MAG: hypothetical protein GY754_24525 [bacterium]|nr:hypothetical protein [bacterium]